MLHFSHSPIQSIFPGHSLITAEILRLRVICILLEIRCAVSASSLLDGEETDQFVAETHGKIAFYGNDPVGRVGVSHKSFMGTNLNKV